MRSTFKVCGICESPWLVIPAKVWTPFTSTVRGPPLSPYDQASWTLVKIFSAHLIGATALSTRTQHRALDCFIWRNSHLAIAVAQDRNLDCWRKEWSRTYWNLFTKLWTWTNSCHNCKAVLSIFLSRREAQSPQLLGVWLQYAVPFAPILNMSNFKNKNALLGKWVRSDVWIFRCAASLVPHLLSRPWPQTEKCKNLFGGVIFSCLYT